MDRILKRAFVVAAIAWAAALPLAAATAATRHAPGGDYALAALAYAIGAMVCHQQTPRSFHLWGVQLPVCARCTGIYLGAALAAIAMPVVARLSQGRAPGPEAPASQRAVLVASAVPIALTLIFEWTTGITPSNTIRALSGVPLGTAVAWVVLLS